MDAKRKKTLGALLGVLVITFGVWWWLHDPFRSLGGNTVLDQTIYYRPADKFFAQPRSQRTLFLEHISMESILAKVKANHSEKQGWHYETHGMPLGFTATRAVAGDDLPESVSALDEHDGKIQLLEIRVMAPSEVQLVKRSQGSDAFILYPGVRVERPAGNTLDPNRFPIIN